MSQNSRDYLLYIHTTWNYKKKVGTVNVLYSIHFWWESAFSTLLCLQELWRKVVVRIPFLNSKVFNILLLLTYTQNLSNYFCRDSKKTFEKSILMNWLIAIPCLFVPLLMMKLICSVWTNADAHWHVCSRHLLLLLPISSKNIYNMMDFW